MRIKRRAPQGARGLKFIMNTQKCLYAKSRPARGAWVEISSALHPRPPEHQSRPARGAWVEI